MDLFSFVLIVILIGFGALGAKRGFLQALVRLVGTVLVFVLSFFLKDVVALFLMEHLPDIKLSKTLGVLSSFNILFYQVISFALLVFVLTFLLRILLSITGILGKVMNMTFLFALPNRILGCLTGALEGYLFLFLILTFLMFPLKTQSWYMNSFVRKFIMNDTPILKESFGGVNKALEDIISKENKSEMNANLIDTMLKYKLISKDYLEKLRKENKLGDIPNLDSILSKY